MVRIYFIALTSPFYAIRYTLSSDFFEFRKKFFDLAKSPDKRKDYQTFLACRELVTLDKCRISKHEKLSSCFFRKNKKYLSNKNRYLQTVSLQVPEKIEKNKLRKRQEKRHLQAFCSQVPDFIDYFHASHSS